MPLVSSNYSPSFLFKNGFFSTVYSGLYRKVKDVSQTRERITLNDGDFIDLDWSYASKPTSKLIIVLHGLEGDAQRPYMLGTAKIFNQNDVDAVCVNFRGCSGEENLKYHSYHSGETNDLKEIIDNILASKSYDEIYLKGFSLGGNVVLKYLGEGNDIPNQVKAGIAVSVPCFLYGSMLQLHMFKNVLYHDRFKKHLMGKLKVKHKLFPEEISKSEIKSIKTLKDFDDVYTSKANGFIDALDYYAKSSSLQFLQSINRPTLIINSLNDSFLSKECFPFDVAKTNKNLFLETPKYGGHVGMYAKNGVYYNEMRALQFIKNKLE